MAFPASVSDCFVIDDSLYEMPSSLLKYFISGACNFSWTSAAVLSRFRRRTIVLENQRVHQFDLLAKAIFLPFQMVFSFNIAAAFCAVLKSTSGLDDCTCVVWSSLL